jgi:antitoxin (DNA-binding transcriptional repressor) of toxin-antitoxin stability system
MDVAMSTLQAELSAWVARARTGEDGRGDRRTDRGTPVARLLSIDCPPLMEQLVAQGAECAATCRAADGTRR